MIEELKNFFYSASHRLNSLPEHDFAKELLRLDSMTLEVFFNLNNSMMLSPSSNQPGDWIF